MSNARPAIFLDRDGVLTEPVWNPRTDEYESPHAIADVRLCDNVAAPLLRALSLGYDLFIVSNQPSYAKGKTSLANLVAIAEHVEATLRGLGVVFRETFYCYHHPRGVIPSYTGACACRKPSPYFLFRAAARYPLDLRRSWMVGDRDTDVECGQRAGCRAILVLHPHASAHQGRSLPDHRAANLAEAVQQVIGHARGSG